MTTPRTLVVGIGSPYGDDQLGWVVANRVANKLRYNQHQVTARVAKSPVDVLSWLENVERLVVCDACHGQGLVGRVHQWTWPAPEVERTAWSGTHDVPLPMVLSLAEQLGRLPKQVVLWAVEASDRSDVISELSPEVSAALPDLVNRIVDQLSELS